MKNKKSKTSTLKTKTMLVNIKISVWAGRKYDRKISEEVATNHGTSADAGRYNKVLLPVAQTHKDLTKYAAKIRFWFYEQTLPWGQDGFRILTCENFLDFSEQWRAHTKKFNELTSLFVNDFANLRDQAKSTLNGLYNDSDYPSEHEIGDKFGIRRIVSPLPDADDFRVDLADEDIDEIRQAITDEVQSAQKLAMDDLWKRLHTVVVNMADKLSDKDGIFRNTLVGNIDDLVELLPKLNITGDENLAKMCKRVKRKLSGHDSAYIRDNPDERQRIADDAKKIQKRMETFMS